jgi:hypothetical protein
MNMITITSHVYSGRKVRRMSVPSPNVALSKGAGSKSRTPAIVAAMARGETRNRTAASIPRKQRT